MMTCFSHPLKATCWTALAALALTGGSTRADAPVSRATQQKIQNDYQKFTAAETSREYDRIHQVTGSFFSPTFTVHTPGGKVLNYAQFLQEMKATAHETLAVQENAFHPHTLRRQGNTLTDTGVYQFTRKFLDIDGDFGAKGKTYQLSERSNYQGKWVKTGPLWRLQSLRLFGRRQIVNGKPFLNG